MFDSSCLCARAVRGSEAVMLSFVLAFESYTYRSTTCCRSSRADSIVVIGRRHIAVARFDLNITILTQTTSNERTPGFEYKTHHTNPSDTCRRLRSIRVRPHVVARQSPVPHATLMPCENALGCPMIAYLDLIHRISVGRTCASAVTRRRVKCVRWRTKSYNAHHVKNVPHSVTMIVQSTTLSVVTNRAPRSQVRN